MKKRPSITPRMKVNALLHRVFMQFGVYLKDAATGEDMKPGDPVVFDHKHGLVFDGPHNWEALRPVLYKTNNDKAKVENRDRAHINRLRGFRRKRTNSSRFPESHQPMASTRWKTL